MAKVWRTVWTLRWEVYVPWQPKKTFVEIFLTRKPAEEKYALLNKKQDVVYTHLFKDTALVPESDIVIMHDLIQEAEKP